jgi:dienelactone hydrolase
VRLPQAKQTSRQLALAGHVVFTPFLTQRRAFSEPWLEDRQWLMRLGYQTGRHIIGAELMQISSVVDVLASMREVDAGRIAVVGHGQGGMTALHSAALDTRIAAAVSSGYLEDTQPEWEQPEDRMLWKLRAYLSNDQIAALVRPRSSAVAPSRAELTGLPGMRPTPPSPVPPKLGPQHGSREGFRDRHAHQPVAGFFRNMALEAADSVQTRWKPDYSSPAAYERSIGPKGSLLRPDRHYPPRRDRSTPKAFRFTMSRATGYRLSVRVYDGVQAYGIACAEGNEGGGEAARCFQQHGLAGMPESSLRHTHERNDAVYSRFGLRLVERGYIVFAPMIATQDNVERTRLIRRAHLTGLIPAGMDLKKFGRLLDYLSTLPYVDANRFAFYGLSYGGYTALWIGPGEPRFRAVISSGHFNDWNVKTTDLTQGTSYTFYPNVVDQYNFGMAGKSTTIWRR